MSVWPDVVKQKKTEELVASGVDPLEAVSMVDRLSRGPASDAAPLDVKQEHKGPREESNDFSKKNLYGTTDSLENLALQLKALRPKFDSLAEDNANEARRLAVEDFKTYDASRRLGSPFPWQELGGALDTSLGTNISPAMKNMETPEQYKADLKSKLNSYSKNVAGINAAKRKSLEDQLEILKTVVPALKPYVIAQSGDSTKKTAPTNDTTYTTPKPPKAGRGSAGKPLTETAVSKITDFDRAIGEAADVNKIIEESADAFGPFVGRVGGVNPYDTTAQNAQGAIDLMKQVIGKSLEGGVLRLEDEKKYSRILPKLSDTPEVAALKAERFMQAVPKMRNDYIKNLRDGGYDMSLFKNSNVPQSTEGGGIATELPPKKDPGSAGQSGTLPDVSIMSPEARKAKIEELKAKKAAAAAKVGN